MTILILKSLGLMLGAFLIAAWIGWSLSWRAKGRHGALEWRPRVSFEEAPEPVPEPATAPQPVAYLDAAAEAFTSGVVAPFPPARAPDADKAPYAPPQPAPRLDTAVGNVLIRREDTSLQRRVSSLAVMTPESIQAAVQQAGTGLEPIRVGVPQSPPDDLTVISGIDAARQRELNGLGIFYYWQVAGWSPENVAWVSNRILSPERVVRENWMSQAARLARLH
jgi:NADH-quinone oxidoreductase subunit E